MSTYSKSYHHESYQPENIGKGSVFIYKHSQYEIVHINPTGAIKKIDMYGKIILEPLYEAYRRDRFTGALQNLGEPKFFVLKDLLRVRFLSQEEILQTIDDDDDKTVDQ